MREEDFIKVLEQHAESWEVGVQRSKKPYKGEEPSQPIKGHPVVLAFKEPQWACDWCDKTCTQGKTISRYSTGAWRVRCLDCKESRFYPSLKLSIINNTSRESES